MPDRIQIDGLNELRRTLKAMGDAEGTNEVKAAGKKAAEIVAPAAKGRASSKLEQRAALTLKPAAVATGGGLRFGGGRGVAVHRGDEQRSGDCERPHLTRAGMISRSSTPRPWSEERTPVSTGWSSSLEAAGATALTIFLSVAAGMVMVVVMLFSLS